MSDPRSPSDAASALPRRRTQQERRETAEGRLLAAATELIAKQGVAGTTLALIGEHAGYSRAIVTHYFGTKTALIKRLVEDSQSRFAASVADTAGLGAVDALSAFAEAYLEGLRHGDAPRQAFIVMWAESAGIGEEVRDWYVAGDRRFRTGISSIVTRGVRSGTVRPDIDASAFAGLFVGQLRGIAVEALVDPEGMRLPALRTELVEVIRRSLAP